MNVMARVSQCEVMSVDLPFRRAFRHAAAMRSSSESLFVKCSTDAGSAGFGESLPRDYVTGETRDAAFDLLETILLPRMLGMKFDCMEELYRFLGECDGKTPPGWLDSATPQLAAWCAAELALLDEVDRLRPLVETTLETGQGYRNAFAECAKAGPTVAKFFDDVMVMTEDAKLREARLRLLKGLERLILQLADVSEIVPEDK